MNTIDVLDFAAGDLGDVGAGPDQTPPSRPPREIVDPFEIYSDVDFRGRYRFEKRTVKQLIELREGDHIVSY